jgi:hypothetical protein
MKTIAHVLSQNDSAAACIVFSGELFLSGTVAGGAPPCRSFQNTPFSKTNTHSHILFRIEHESGLKKSRTSTYNCRSRVFRFKKIHTSLTLIPNHSAFLLLQLGLLLVRTHEFVCCGDEHVRQPLFVGSILNRDQEVAMNSSSCSVYDMFM